MVIHGFVMNAKRNMLMLIGVMKLKWLANSGMMTIDFFYGKLQGIGFDKNPAGLSIKETSPHG
jgi:hypothetical protein